MIIEVYSGVVLQGLVDDRGDLMLRQRHQLAGVGTFSSSPRLFIRSFQHVAVLVGLSFRLAASRARGLVIVGTHSLVSRASAEPLPSAACYGIVSCGEFPRFHAI
jgi:hypothetical protein